MVIRVNISYHKTSLYFHSFVLSLIFHLIILYLLFIYSCVFCELKMRMPPFRDEKEFGLLTKVFNQCGTPTDQVLEKYSHYPDWDKFVTIAGALPTATSSLSRRYSL